MKFKDYVNNLNQLLLSSPETADFDVVTSSDDEGNYYREVYFEPSVGYYDHDDGYRTEEDVGEWLENDMEDLWFELNAVCVN